MAVVVTRCPHCQADEMTMSVEAHWRYRNDDGRAVITARCGRCDLPISILAVSDGTVRTGAIPQTGANVDLLQHWRIRQKWPPDERTAAPEHCTPAVERVFVQAVSAFKRRELDAAGAMFRKTLEVALKEKAPDVQGEWLAKRIRTLAERGILTKDLADWADGIKSIGDPATHEVDEPAEDDIRNLAGATEATLRYLFTLPGMVASMRENPPEPVEKQPN